MPTQTETYVNQIKLNRLTQTQFSGASISDTELYLVDPEFSGNKLLQTDSDGDIVESQINPSQISIESVVTLSDSSTITVQNNYYYNGGEISAFGITLPSYTSYPFACQFDFSSGATPTTITYTGAIKWIDGSDDLQTSGGVTTFVPVANKRYTIVLYCDGVNFCGTVKGV